MGIRGPRGPQGTAGPPGAAGVGLAAYGHVFNASTGVGAITILAGADVPFSSNGVLNNVAHTPGEEEIILPLAGDYELIFHVTSVGSVAGVLSAFAFTVNGVVQPQSNFAVNVLGIAGLAAQVSGAVILSVPAGATITLRNVGGVTVPLLNISILGGPFNNASVTVKKLDALA